MNFNFFLFILPVIMVVGMYGVVGSDPFNLSLGIANHGEICLKNNGDWYNSGNLSCNDKSGAL
jgi:hypothetical protein